MKSKKETSNDTLNLLRANEKEPHKKESLHITSAPSLPEGTRKPSNPLKNIANFFHTEDKKESKSLIEDTTESEIKKVRIMEQSDLEPPITNPIKNLKPIQYTRHVVLNETHKQAIREELTKSLEITNPYISQYRTNKDLLFSVDTFKDESEDPCKFDLSRF